MSDEFDALLDTAEDAPETPVEEVVEADTADVEEAVVEEASTEPSTKELLQQLADLIAPKVAPKDEPKVEDAPAEYNFPGVGIPDDVYEALENEDPALRRKALAHLQNATVQTALKHYDQHIMKTIFPALAQGLFKTITAAVQEQQSTLTAKERFFKDNPDLSVLNDETFAPILNKIHADISTAKGVRWSPEVAAEMAKRLRSVVSKLGGKGTAPTQKAPQRLNGGTAVRQSTTPVKPKPGELSEAELRSFFT